MRPSLSKSIRKTAVVAEENRCEICSTKLTLYPKDYMECPHCHKKVCRQCWDNAWASKSFSAENCTHLTESDGLDPVAYAQKERNVNLDWPRMVFIGVGALAVLGGVLFLLNLLVF
jgi:hypothetical protein